MAKVELTPMKLACLKAAAECINPAHRSWYLNDYKRWVETYENGDAIIVCHPEQIQPALSFIAEADPATVLAMVQEIERFRHFVRETLDELHECYNEESCKICKEIDRVIESEATQ